MIVGNAYFNSTITYATLSISSASNANDNISLVAMAGSGLSINITRVVKVSAASQTWYLVATCSNTFTLTSPACLAVRIG